LTKPKICAYLLVAGFPDRGLLRPAPTAARPPNATSRGHRL
jgi:hypothetical protein